MSARAEQREQFLADVVSCAVEGGTGYWAQVSEYRHLDGPGSTYAVLHPLKDDEDGYQVEGLRLNLDAVARGILRIANGVVSTNPRTDARILRASRENDACSLDADDADVIAQAALLGAVIYG